MTTYVAAVDGKGAEVIAAAATDYDRVTRKGSPLRTAGAVGLDDKGIVVGDNAKSGWINVPTWGRYTKPGASVPQYVVLQGVSFWINMCGKHWSDFEVKRALLANLNQDGTIDPTSQVVSVSIGMKESAQLGNQPVVVIDGKYNLVPDVRSLLNIFFVEESKSAKPKVPRSNPTKPRRE